MIGSIVGATTDEWVNAAATAVGTLIFAFLVRGAFRKRNKKISEAVLRGDMSQPMGTRLQFFERLIFFAIIVIGMSIAVLQFDGVNEVAQAILFSGAIAAAVIGFSARQSLANLVAGIMLAIAQPLRVGDWVTFDDNYGLVEDVTLTYTRLRTPNDRHVMIPNDRLISGVLVNETLGSKIIALETDVWVLPTTDIKKAIAAIEAETEATVTVAQVTHEGIRLNVRGKPCAAPDRASCAAELRAQSVHRLQTEKLLG